MGNRRFDIQDDILQVAEEVQTRVVILDEAHQGIGKNGNNADVLATVFKDLANGCVFSLAVAGTERARVLQTASEEFKQRCMYDYTIEPLKWDDPGDRRILLDVLGEYDLHLSETVFGRSSGLTEPDLASILCEAGGGLIGSVAVLVETAGKLGVDAMLAGTDKCLTLGHLAQAFRTSSLRHDVKKDPFHNDADRVHTPAISDVKTRLKGRSRQAGHDARFRR